MNNRAAGAVGAVGAVLGVVVDAVGVGDAAVGDVEGAEGVEGVEAAWDGAAADVEEDGVVCVEAVDFEAARDASQDAAGSYPETRVRTVDWGSQARDQVVQVVQHCSQDAATYGVGLGCRYTEAYLNVHRGFGLWRVEAHSQNCFGAGIGLEEAALLGLDDEAAEWGLKTVPAADRHSAAEVGQESVGNAERLRLVERRARIGQGIGDL